MKIITTVGGGEREREREIKRARERESEQVMAECTQSRTGGGGEYIVEEHHQSVYDSSV